MRFWARNQTITCQELVELVTDYLEGALPARDRRRFEGHIAGCPHCTAYVEQMQITIRTLGRIEPESISAEAREDLLEAFRDWKRG
jgi:anti-sigma factor RsiW